MIDMLEVELIVQGFAIDALNAIGSVAGRDGTELIRNCFSKPCGSWHRH